jgi:hypothetical protein
MQNLKGTGIDCAKDDWSTNCSSTWIRALRPKLDPVETKFWRLAEEFEKDAVCRRLSSTCTANALPRKPLNSLENSKYEDTVKCADDLVLLVEEEPLLQGVLERLIEIGRWYGMEINVDKTKVLRISKQQFPLPAFLPWQITMLRIPSA